MIADLPTKTGAKDPVCSGIYARAYYLNCSPPERVCIYFRLCEPSTNRPSFAPTNQYKVS